MRPGRFFLHPGPAGHFWWPHLLGLGLSSLLWLGLLGLLIWAVLRLARGRPMLGGGSRFASAQAPWQPFAADPTTASEPSATEILRQRYARGEIDADTFQQMLEHVQATVPSPSATPADSTDPVNFGDHPTVWMDSELPAHPVEPTEGTMD